MGASSRAERITFSYPAVPEIRLYFAIVVLNVCYGLYRVYGASRDYQWVMGDYGVQSQLPVIGLRIKDSTSWEWSSWSPFAWRYLPVFIAHTVVFNLGTRFLPELPFTVIYTFLSIASCTYYFTPLLVAISLAQGTLMFIACHFCRRKLVVWVSSLPILYYMMHETVKISDNPFLIFTFVSYSMLSYVSYCMDTMEGPVRKEENTLAKRYLRMLFYTFYQPYLFSLIVLYADFERQMAERKTKTRNWMESIMFALRIAFWWGLLELTLHFLYFEAILRNAAYAESLPKDTFFALGACLGIFFHWKYVVIFGLPSIFARLDNMQPLPGPICISRIMLFSKVWREFDRGLYQFFKQYIFVPICAPTFSLPRKVLGVFVSYSFVLLWHGFYHHNIVWIILNIAALLMEMSAKSLYSVYGFRIWRERTVGDVAFRRILAWLQVLPFAFGLYSNIYFLGGSQTGALFVKRIYEEETVTLRWPFFLLITLGYVYANISMEVDRRKELQEKEEKRKLT